MPSERFEIADRFRGPPRSANGGYTCGRIARHLQGTIAVRLKSPPPLNAELRLEYTDEQAHLFHETTLIGEAKRSQLVLQAPPSPTYVQAEEAARSFLGFKSHAFPGCFVCGPERAADDGLRIFPGPLNGSASIAATWTPCESLADAAGNLKPEFLWSALDCPGGFALYPLPNGVAIVLGELTASILGDVKTGDRCIVLGWPLGMEGRKRFAGSAIYAPDHRLVGLARAVWIEVPLSTWN